MIPANGAPHDLEVRDVVRTLSFAQCRARQRPEGIYVLHCFQKKTQKTRQQDLDLAHKRFKSIQVKS